MRLLLSTPSTRDADVSYHSILGAALDERGHDVTVLQFAEYPRAERLDIKTAWVTRSVDRYIDERLPFRWPWLTSFGRWTFNWVLYHRWRTIVRRELRSGAYDAIVVAGECTTPGTLAADDVGLPALIVTTGPITIKYDPSNEALDKTPFFQDLPWSKRVQYPFIWAIHRWNAAAFERAAEVVAVSEFDASTTGATFGRTPRVVYIPVPFEACRAPDWRPRKVTLVNPRDRNKGLDLFLEVARRLPDHEFQIAGTLYDPAKERHIEALDNVTYLGWCDDMREIYATTKLLLAPSTYQEGGNRVIPEAFVNGIPAVGSDLGGIPDYIADAGETVEDYTDVDAWVDVVKRLLEDEAFYKEKSRLASERSKAFEASPRIDEVEALLEHIVGSG